MPVHADFSSVGRGDRVAQLELIWGVIEKQYNHQVEQFDNLVAAFESKLGDDSPYKGKTGKDLLMELAQNYYLREIDHFWRAHLTTMTGVDFASRLCAERSEARVQARGFYAF